MDAHMLATLQEFKSMPIVVELVIKGGGDRFIGLCQKGFNLRDDEILIEFDFFMNTGDKKVTKRYILVVTTGDKSTTISAKGNETLIIDKLSETITIETLSKTLIELCVALLERQQT